MATPKGLGAYTKNTLTQWQAAKLYAWFTPFLEVVSTNPKTCRYKADPVTGRHPTEVEIAERATAELGFLVVAKNIANLRKEEWGDMARDPKVDPNLFDGQEVIDLRERVAKLEHALERHVTLLGQVQDFARELRVEVDKHRLALKFHGLAGDGSITANYHPPK